VHLKTKHSSKMFAILSCQPKADAINVCNPDVEKVPLILDAWSISFPATEKDVGDQTVIQIKIGDAHVNYTTLPLNPITRPVPKLDLREIAVSMPGQALDPLFLPVKISESLLKLWAEPITVQQTMDCTAFANLLLRHRKQLIHFKPFVYNGNVHDTAQFLSWPCFVFVTFMDRMLHVPIHTGMYIGRGLVLNKIGLSLTYSVLTFDDIYRIYPTARSAHLLLGTCSHVCDFCGKSPATLRTCQSCRCKQYCNRDCQNSAWVSVHRGECPMLASQARNYQNVYAISSKAMCNSKRTN
jgi:hypothetical protein